MVDASQIGEVDSDTIQPEIAGRIANTFWWEKDGENYAHWALSGTLAFDGGRYNILGIRFRVDF